MSARWVHVIAVLAVAALFVNSQCYALCLASLHQTILQSMASGCHKSSHSQNEGDAGCHHRQGDLTSTEASPDLAKIPAVSLPVVTLLPLSDNRAPGTARFTQRHATRQQRGSPPGTPLFLSLSVLRI